MIPPAHVVVFDDAHTFGGAQIALGNALQVMTHGSHTKITLVTTQATRARLRLDVLELPRLDIIECPPALPYNIFAFVVRLRFFFTLLEKLRGVDYWLFNLSGIEFCLAPLVALSGSTAPRAAWLHNPYPMRGTIRRRWAVLTAFDWLRDALANRLIFARYHTILTPSNENAAVVRSRMIRFTAHTGALYPTVPPAAAAIRSVDMGTDIVKLYVVGRIEFGHKNQMCALQTARLLAARGQPTQLVFIGDGPDRTRLEAEARRLAEPVDVHFTGWISDPWSVIDPAGIVLMPSWMEGMPLVAIEAMNRGLRLATSPLAIFREGVPAICVAASYEPDDFARTIHTLLLCRDAEIRQQYQPCTARFTAENFRLTLCAALAKS
ncbi:MAG: hypothetical protein NVS9B10_05240 [Nevskia sp.]